MLNRRDSTESVLTCFHPCPLLFVALCPLSRFYFTLVLPGLCDVDENSAYLMGWVRNGQDIGTFIYVCDKCVLSACWLCCHERNRRSYCRGT